MNEPSSAIDFALAYGSGTELSSNHLHQHHSPVAALYPANLSGSDSREAAARLAASLASLSVDQTQAANIQYATGGPPTKPSLTKATTTTTTATTTTTNTINSRHQEHALIVNDLLLQFVNLNVVRKMIAQNFVEFLMVCVIISYLIFYFCFISKVSINYSSVALSFLSNVISSLLTSLSQPTYLPNTTQHTAT